MPSYQLRLTLLSDATFGRGDGVAGLVDAEVQHDDVGLPFLGGRTLKGLLGAECADIVYALERGRPDQAERWRTAEKRLFGRSGAALEGQSILQRRRCATAGGPAGGAAPGYSAWAAYSE